jgi:hypothetical protein
VIGDLFGYQSQLGLLREKRPLRLLVFFAIMYPLTPM